MYSSSTNNQHRPVRRAYADYLEKIENEVVTDPAFRMALSFRQWFNESEAHIRHGELIRELAQTHPGKVPDEGTVAITASLDGARVGPDLPDGGLTLRNLAINVRDAGGHMGDFQDSTLAHGAVAKLLVENPGLLAQYSSRPTPPQSSS